MRDPERGGVMWCMSACVGCGRLFGYSPTRVPSVRLHADGDPDEV